MRPYFNFIILGWQFPKWPCEAIDNWYDSDPGERSLSLSLCRLCFLLPPQLMLGCSQVGKVGGGSAEDNRRRLLVLRQAPCREVTLGWKSFSKMFKIEIELIWPCRKSFKPWYRKIMKHMFQCSIIESSLSTSLTFPESTCTILYHTGGGLRPASCTKSSTYYDLCILASMGSKMAKMTKHSKILSYKLKSHWITIIYLYDDNILCMYDL